jgi:hypothetical protein
MSARALYERALTIFEALEAGDGVAYVSSLLGQTEYEAGNLKAGVELLERSREAYGKLQNNRSSASTAAMLGKFALEAGDLERAHYYARDTLTLLRFDREFLFFTVAIEILAHVATLGGDARRGCVLHGYVEVALGEKAEGGMGQVFFHKYYTLHERLLEEKVGALELRRLMAEGATLSEDRALEEALAVDVPALRNGQRKRRG